MKTSSAGVAAIAQREGRRLSAYRDGRGVWTIGVGHTGRMSPPPVTPDMKITQSECDMLLAQDLAPVEAAIDSAIRVPLTQNEFDALASLGFNIGADKLRGAQVVRHLNRGDVAAAAKAFLNWSKPASLLTRRQSEMAQFLAGSALLQEARSVLTQRADQLELAAKAVKVKARTAGASVAVIAPAGVAAVATTHAHQSHIGLLIAIALALVGIAAVSVIAVLARHAQALRANAALTRVVQPLPSTELGSNQ
jgi:lysozyme